MCVVTSHALYYVLCETGQKRHFTGWKVKNDKIVFRCKELNHTSESAGRSERFLKDHRATKHNMVEKSRVSATAMCRLHRDTSADKDELQGWDDERARRTTWAGQAGRDWCVWWHWDENNLPILPPHSSTARSKLTCMPDDTPLHVTQVLHYMVSQALASGPRDPTSSSRRFNSAHMFV